MKNNSSIVGKNIKRLLNRHGYKVELNDENTLTIFKAKAKPKEKGSFIQYFLFFFLTVLVVSSFMILGRIIGVIIFFSAIFFAIIDRNKKELDRIEDSNDLINISDDFILIKKAEQKDLKIAAEDIKEIESILFEKEQPYRGRIILKGNGFGEVILLDLSSDNVKYLDDDLGQLEEFIYTKLYDGVGNE